MFPQSRVNRIPHARQTYAERSEELERLALHAFEELLAADVTRSALLLLASHELHRSIQPWNRKSRAPRAVAAVLERDLAGILHRCSFLRSTSQWKGARATRSRARGRLGERLGVYIRSRLEPAPRSG